MSSDDKGAVDHLEKMDLKTLEEYFKAFRKEEKSIKRQMRYLKREANLFQVHVVREGYTQFLSESKDSLQDSYVAWAILDARYRYMKAWRKACNIEIQRREADASWKRLEAFARCTYGGAIRNLKPDDIAKFAFQAPLIEGKDSHAVCESETDDSMSDLDRLVERLRRSERTAT